MRPIDKVFISTKSSSEGGHASMQDAAGQSTAAPREATLPSATHAHRDRRPPALPPPLRSRILHPQSSQRVLSRGGRGAVLPLPPRSAWPRGYAAPGVRIDRPEPVLAREPPAGGPLA